MDKNTEKGFKDAGRMARERDRSTFPVRCVECEKLTRKNAKLQEKLDKYLLEEEIDMKLRRNSGLGHLLMAGKISFDEYKNRFEE